MNKFKLFLSVMAVLLLGSTAIMAQESKGYALFGTVPEGYEDLTSKVTIEAVGSATFVDGVFTGAGLPGRICESGNYLKMSFTEAQALNLTEDFEVHVVLAKAEAAAGNVQVAFCNNGWNNGRLGYTIPNADINTTDTDIALAYADRVSTDWNSYGETSFIGAPANFPAAEIFRLCAASGEQFTIKAIYVTAESAGNTEPEPEVIGYAIFGEVPTGYVDLTGNVEVSTTINGAGDAINATDYTTPSSIAFTGKGLGGNYVCQQNVAVAIRFKENQEMKLTDQMAIHVKMKRADDKTEGALELTMCHTTWGGAGSRLSFEIPNTKVTAAEKEVLLKYANFSTKSGVSTYNQGNLLGGKTFPGGAGKELFRVCAINGEQFEITQIYIEKTYTPEQAPTNVTATATATDWDKVTLNLKADCERSTVVTYEVTYGSTTKTFTGNAGETTTYVIDGLQGSTTYNFSVVAKNEDGVAASAVETTATTPAKPATAEVRYYFYRTGDLPANSADLLNIDMRDGKGSTISTNQASKVADETTFSKYLMSKSWGFVQVKANESSLEDVTGDWYLCVRYKSTHPGDVYVNVAASDKNMLLLAEKENNDNLWKTKKVKLSDFLNTSYSFPVAANSDLFQFDTNNNNASESGYLTVDYAYLTNNENSEDLGYQDVTAPVMTVNQTDLTGTSVSFNIVGIDDSDSKIYYTISDGTNNYEFTYNSKEAYDYQVTGLEKGTDYTITITAKDPFGNQSTWSQTITTIGDATAPEMVSVNKGEVLDNSIELLLKANDNQEGTLIYTISVGGNTYTTTGLAGEEVSYKVSGLTPNTEYEFSVVATDAGENTSAPIVVKYSTTAFVAYRYYLVGEGDASNPNHIAVASNTEYSNSTCYQDERISNYYSLKANTTWMAVAFKPTEDVPNTINTVDADNWYIVMRMRSSMDNNIFGWNRFRVNLVNNGQNFYLNTSDWFGVTSLGDGQWHTVKFKLSAAAGTVPAQFLQKDQIAVQLHVNDQLQKDEFFDIDYLYFTNEVVEDHGTQDGYKILLRDTKDNTALLNTYNAQTVDVDLNRSFVADGAWYTLCLPFSMTADQVNAAFGACKLAKLNSSELRGSSLIHLNFDYVNTIEAGVPYLFMPMANVNPVIIEDVKIDNTLRPIETTYFNMNGIFYPTHVATGDYFLGTDNYLIAVKDGDSSNLKGLRAYFTIGAGAPASARARVVMAPTVATDLQENTITTTAEKVIIDGTIYILRGDKIYTTTGQLVK